MADKMRWKYGDTNPVVAAVDAATVIEIGDLVFQDVDDAKPATLHPDQGTEALNRERFIDKFLGVAMQRSRAGDVTPIRVATTGVFEYDCPSTAFELGDLVTPAANATANGLMNQRVVKVAGTKNALGRVAKRVSPASTAVLVGIVSSVMAGGVEGTSPAA